VINGTGVVLHTNLGRAPLSEALRDTMLDAAFGYSTLEFDLKRVRAANAPCTWRNCCAN
jgi:L-seryl-tRNA(Ser) seleniumtransferase